jgi:sialate O-acetylesterase
LIVKNKYGYLQGFAIAGADQQFVWAKAYVNKNNQVVVYNDEIANPLFVRYAWSDNPGDANLFNQERLPASPFQASE